MFAAQQWFNTHYLRFLKTTLYVQKLLKSEISTIIGTLHRRILCSFRKSFSERKPDIKQSEYSTILG
jgi:hypothetical protein